MTGSQRGSVMGERRQSEVGSVVSYATANTNASRYTHLVVAAQVPCALSEALCKEHWSKAWLRVQPCMRHLMLMACGALSSSGGA